MSISYEDLLNLFQNSNKEFTKIRRDLHKIPEHGFEEVKTASYVQNLLKEYGYEVQTGFGVTGFTAVLDSGKPGKVVGLRTELDGIYATETNDVDYKSQHPGCMHGCGHDGHMATILMLAKHLKDHKDLFKGKIVFVFQPAEEGGGGALKMIEDGVLEKLNIDCMFAYHNIFVKKHVITVKDGAMMAGVNSLSIKIEGTGGHGSSPWLAKSPLYAAIDIANAVSTMKSQHNIFEQYVLNLTNLHSGSGPNVIPAEAEMTYSFRHFSDELHDRLIEKLKIILDYVERSHDVKCHLKFQEVPYPTTINHKAESDLVLEVSRGLFDDDMVEVMENPVMGSEDFSFFLQRVPGCMFFVGNGEENVNHNVTYDFDDEIIPTAAVVMAAAAIEWLNRN